MLNKLKILLTATGAPGCSTLIRKLKENGERGMEIIGTDAGDNVIGAFWADKFYRVPSADDPEYISAIEAIVKEERPDVFFPVSSAEVLPIAKNRPIFEPYTRVMVSDPDPISIAANKYEVYSLLREKGLPVPEFCYPRSLEEFVKAAMDMGYPKRKLCFKPHVSKGSRGFRILDESISRKDLLLNHKPESRYMSLQEFEGIFEGEGVFPDLLLMEVVEGVEYDAMSLCYKGDSLIVTIKTREQTRWGIITLGELVNAPEIVSLVDQIISTIPLSYNVSLQFINNKLIEINPRTSTYIYQDDLNEPYLAVKLCLGELSEEEIHAYRSRVRFGRRMIRYMDQIFWEPGGQYES